MVRSTGFYWNSTWPNCILRNVWQHIYKGFSDRWKDEIYCVAWKDVLNNFISLLYFKVLTLYCFPTEIRCDVEEKKSINFDSSTNKNKYKTPQVLTLDSLISWHHIFYFKCMLPLTVIQCLLVFRLPSQTPQVLASFLITFSNTKQR